MKYAWIENGVIRDTTTEDPATIFHPDIAALYSVAVPDGAVSGDTFENDVLTVRPIEVLPPVEPPPRTISAADVRAKLTFAERVKWDAGKLDEIVTAKIEFATPRSEADAIEILNFLVDAEIISLTSAAKIV